MGVKDLWNILAPTSQKSTIYDLQGKTIAIDLSCWACEGQIVGERVVSQPRMYLRNIFFRTQLLLMANVTPVFVIDGVAPDLKLNVMRQRNQKRFKYKDTPAAGTESKPGRSRFRGIANNCRKMLELMGVKCLDSTGEAEAYCAQLNRDGIVDGVISQDSDVFLYGARVVYRNLISKAGSGTIDVYEMKDIEEKLNLTREKLIAMSLLCGCDYDQAGVQGIGKETAYKYLRFFNGDILQRLQALRNDKTLQRYDEERNNCTKCCHPGKCMDHRRSGCSYCNLEKGCFENLSDTCFKNLIGFEKEMANVELMIRKKSVNEPDFPKQETVDEFLSFNQVHQDKDVTWLKPDVSKFCLFCKKMLEWDLEYSFEKIMPLLTRWLLLRSPSYDFSELSPANVLKKRTVRGIPSVDVAWDIIDENFSAFVTLLSDECKILCGNQCITTEPISLFANFCPLLYDEFVEKGKKKPLEKKCRKKKLKNLELKGSIQEDSRPKAHQSNIFDLTAVFQEQCSVGNDIKRKNESIKASTKKTVVSTLHDEDVSDVRGLHSDIADLSYLFQNSFYLSNSSILTNTVETNQCASSPSSLLAQPLNFGNLSSIMNSPGLQGAMDSPLLQQECLMSGGSASSLIVPGVANEVDDNTILNCSDSSDNTIDYDISLIVDDIISRRQFY